MNSKGVIGIFVFFGVWGLGFRDWDWGSDIRIPWSTCRVKGEEGFKVNSLAVRIQGSEFRLWGLGLKVQGFGCRVWGVKSRVSA